MAFTVELLLNQILGGAAAPSPELTGFGREDSALDKLNIG